MDEMTFAPGADLLAEANGVIDSHWLRPGEEWRKMCEHCAYGTCPRLIWAEAWLARLARRGW